MPPCDEPPRVWLSVSDGPRSEPCRGFQENDPAIPWSRKPPPAWVSSPRALTSAEMPLFACDHASPGPISAPKPVSASPSSWRMPTSRDGVSSWPPNARPRQLPSSPSRTRVTPAVAASSPDVFSEDVRTTIASEVPASSKPPSDGASTATPRTPRAAIMSSMSVRRGATAFPSPSSGVSVSMPAP